jgi:hypothetical protein
MTFVSALNAVICTNMLRHGSRRPLKARYRSGTSQQLSPYVRSPGPGLCSCGCGLGLPSPGWCRRSSVGADKRGWPGIRRPCPPVPDPGGPGAGPDHSAGRGCGPARPGTAGCPPAAQRLSQSTAAFAAAHTRGGSWWTARHGTGPAHDQLARRPSRRAARPADPPFPRPRRMLVRPDHGGIHRDIPGDQPRRIRPRLQAGEDSRPGPITLPGPEQPIHRRPRPVPLRHIPPRHSRPSAPADSINQLPLRPRRRPARLLPPGQQRLQHGPLRVTEVRAATDRYGRHEVSGAMVFLVVDSSTGDLRTFRAATRHVTSS